MKACKICPIDLKCLNNYDSGNMFLIACIEFKQQQELMSCLTKLILDKKSEKLPILTTWLK